MIITLFSQLALLSQLSWDHFLGIFCLILFDWELLLLIFRLAAFTLELWLGNHRLGTFAWQLLLGAYELLLGTFRLGGALHNIPFNKLE